MLDREESSQFRVVRFWRVLVVLWLTYCCYNMMRRPFSVARAEIEKELEVSAAALSWVDTSFIVTYSVAQFLYGTLKNRMGSAQILLLGFCCSISSCAVMTMSSSIPVFVLVWGLNGLAQGTGWAACMEVLNAWVFPLERGRVMGVWSTNMAAGGVLGNVIPAYLMGRGMTWRSAALLETICGPCVVCVLAWALLKRHPNEIGVPSVQQAAKGITAEQLKEMPKIGVTADGEFIFATSVLSTGDENGESATALGGMRRPSAEADPRQTSVGALLCLPGALGYSLSYFCNKLVRYGFMLWLPYYLRKELNASAEMAGYIASAFDVGGVAGIVLSGYVSDCLFGGRRRTLVLLLFTAGMAASTLLLGTASVLLQGSTSVCIAIVFLVGLFSFAVDALQSGPCLLGYCDALGAPVGAMSGVVGGIGSFGSAFQGVFTVVMSASSWSALFVSFSVVTVLAGLLLWRALAMEAKGGFVKGIARPS